MTDSPVRQLRIVIEAEDYSDAVAFFRDALGLTEAGAFSGPGGADVTILDAGRATLEIANPAQKRFIDEVEAAGAPSPRIRLAFEVDDADGVTRRLAAAGAALVSAPVETPWRSRNSRLDAPAGVQVTLFEELDPEKRAPLG